MTTSSVLPICVLVVDDNQHMRSILKELLKSANVQDIKEASDPVDAFEILKTVPVDILIADLSMPMIDGVEFTKMVRTGADSPNPFLPIIMVTGHSERSKVMAARDAGVNEFLVKPVTAKSLMDRLALVVNAPRPFVKAAGYFGPDRRRRQNPNFEGPWRRKSDGDKARRPADDSFEV
jgi:two-component system, chemotaxis family, chemotaxis protein CheY